MPSRVIEEVTVLGGQRKRVGDVEISLTLSIVVGIRRSIALVAAIDREHIPQVLGSDAVTVGARVVDRLVDLALARVEVTGAGGGPPRGGGGGG